MQPELERAAAAFDAALHAADGAVDLLRAVLAIGLIVAPALDLEAEERRVAALAEEIQAATGRLPSGREGVQALNRALFVERGFSGNVEQYDDPRNCFLHELLRRRTGLPITLSVLYITLGNRLGLELVGVGFPAHFIVRQGSEGGGYLYLDPFSGGIELQRQELAEVLARQGGRPEQLDLFLAAVTPRQILDRMLNNVKARYLARSDYRTARAAVELKLVLAPWDLEELRDRGLLSSSLGDDVDALADLESYLQRSPGAPDHARITAHVAELRQRLQ
jgi:regulator of sirC expression with transglutaminase-like and TPR domain